MVRTTPGQKIPIDKLQATLASLEKLQEKDKEELSLPESVYFLQNSASIGSEERLYFLTKLPKQLGGNR